MQEMLGSTNVNLSMEILQADSTQVPTETTTYCYHCGEDPVLASSAAFKAIDSVSNPRGTLTLFVVLVLCGMIILFWLSRRRRVQEDNSYVYIPRRR